jgi:hypothetical protein
VGTGNRLTSETTMPPRPRSHSEPQRDGHRLHATLVTEGTNPAGLLPGHGDVVPTRDRIHIGTHSHGRGHGRGHVHGRAHTHGHGHGLTTYTITSTTTTTADRGIRPRESVLKQCPSLLDMQNRYLAPPDRSLPRRVGEAGHRLDEIAVAAVVGVQMLEEPDTNAVGGSSRLRVRKA